MKNLSLLVLLCSALSAAAQLKSTTVGGVSTTGRTGLVCLGGDVYNKDCINSASTTDYAHLAIPAGTGCVHYLHSTLDAPADAGTHAGFLVAGANLTNLISGITVSTYEGSTLRESVNGSQLLSVLDGGITNLYFQTTRSYDAVRISFSGLASVAYNLGIYEGYGALYPPVMLPLQFTSLTAAPILKGWKLSCVLNTPETVLSADAEGSTDGHSFAAVAARKSGTGAERSFEVAADGHRFYRIRVTTDAGTYYSRILRVEPASGRDGLSVQATTGQLTVTLQGAARGRYTVELLDVWGRFRFRKDLNADGLLQLQAALSLSPGIYVARVRSSGGAIIQKVAVGY